MAQRRSLAASRYGLLTWVLLACVLVLGYIVADQALRPREPKGPAYEALKPTPQAAPSKTLKADSQKKGRTAKPDSQPNVQPASALADQIRKLEREVEQKDKDLKAKEREMKAKDEEIDDLRLRLLIYESRQAETP